MHGEERRKRLKKSLCETTRADYRKEEWRNSAILKVSTTKLPKNQDCSFDFFRFIL